MSFTSEIKKEICKEEIDAQMMKAQLCALFQMRASLHMNWQGMYLSFQTENATIAKHVFQIMKTLYDVQQLLKNFGIFVYVGKRMWDIELMALELDHLYKAGVIDKQTFLSAKLVLNREHGVEEKRAKSPVKFNIKENEE